MQRGNNACLCLTSPSLPPCASVYLLSLQERKQCVPLPTSTPSLPRVLGAWRQAQDQQAGDFGCGSHKHKINKPGVLAPFTIQA